MRLHSIAAALVLASGAMHAQPNVINVEIDYMVTTTHSHLPSQDVLDALVQMFACQGITLNLFVSDAVPHENVVRCGVPGPGQPFFTCGGLFSFSAYKAAYSQTAGIGGWHYCLIAHDYDNGNGTGSSGLAEGGGNDFIVTLGSFNSGAGGTDFEIAATFAHELGHNLGLEHTSPQSPLAIDPGEEYAPNYASVMSYQYQLEGVASQMECLGLVTGDHRLKDLDYSHGLMGPLDEDALVERVGVGAHAVDWDCDGVVGTTAVDRDVDEDAPWCDVGGGFGTLRDHDDWANIQDFAFSARVADDSTVHPVVPCITAREHEAMQAQRLANPALCPGPAPTLVTEPCITSRMAWVDPSASGTQDGSGDHPYAGLAQALAATPFDSVLYLQAGTYTNGAAPLVITERVVLGGCGVAVIDP